MSRGKEAKREGILIIEAGGRLVRGAYFEPLASGQVELAETIFEERLGEGLSGPQWALAVVQALRGHAEKWRGVERKWVLPSALSILTKSISVPVVEARRRAQVVAFEVQKNLPFNLNEVVWDADVMSRGAETEELFLAATKRVEPEALCRALRGIGWEVECMVAAPVCAAGVLQMQAVEDGDAGQLLIDVEAEAIHLVFQAKDAVQVRTVALGTHSLVQGIADALGVDGDEAEGAYGAYVREEDRDSDRGKSVQLQVESHLRKLQTELMRSVANFRRQEGAALETVFLTGPGVAMPGLRRMLESKLKLTVALASLEGLATGELCDGDSLLASAAHSAYFPQRPTVNLLPQVYQEDRIFRRKIPVLLAACVFLALAPTLPLVQGIRAQGAAADVQDRVKRELRPMEARQSELFALSARAEELTEAVSAMEGLLATRGNWNGFLADLQQRLVLVEDVWLDELDGFTAAVAEEETADTGEFLGEDWEEDVVYDEFGNPVVAEPKRLKKLRLTGRMVDRQNPLARVSSNVQRRVNRLIDTVAESGFVEAVEEKRFDTSRDGVLWFEFVVVLDERNPL